jgi:Reverse transcriptase (RNA-dependent DNA polymerase)
VDPKQCQKIEIEPGKFINISRHIQGDLKTLYLDLLQQYKDVFAWSHSDLKGIPAHLGEHRIDLLDGAIPIRQRQYRLNPKYSLLVKEELDKLLAAGFIYPVLSSEWVSPIVIVPKKTGSDGKPKIRVCQDFRKLNAATQKDHYPLPFIDLVLDMVALHELYSFLDGYSGYNQVSIRQEDQDKTTFMTDLGTFAFWVMPFGLCNAPGTFQWIMMIIFQDFLRKFLEIFINDFCVYGAEKDHLKHLK